MFKYRLARGNKPNQFILHELHPYGSRLLHATREQAIHAIACGQVSNAMLSSSGKILLRADLPNYPNQSISDYFHNELTRNKIPHTPENILQLAGFMIDYYPISNEPFDRHIYTAFQSAIQALNRDLLNAKIQVSTPQTKPHAATDRSHLRVDFQLTDIKTGKSCILTLYGIKEPPYTYDTHRKSDGGLGIVCVATTSDTNNAQCNRLEIQPHLVAHAQSGDINWIVKLACKSMNIQTPIKPRKTTKVTTTKSTPGYQSMLDEAKSIKANIVNSGENTICTEYTKLALKALNNLFVYSILDIIRLRENGALDYEIKSVDTPYRRDLGQITVGFKLTHPNKPSINITYGISNSPASIVRAALNDTIILCGMLSYIQSGMPPVVKEAILDLAKGYTENER